MYQVLFFFVCIVFLHNGGAENYTKVLTLVVLLYPCTPHCPLHKFMYIPYLVAIVDCAHVYHVEIQHISYLVTSVTVLM